MEINGFLVDGVAVVGKISGERVDDETKNGKNQHTVIIDGDGIEEAVKGFVDDERGAKEEDDGGDEGAKDGVASVAVGVIGVGLAFGFAF